MAADPAPPTPPQPPEPPKEPTPDEVEEAFWKKFDERVTGHLDSFFDRKLKEIRRPGTSRAGGRPYLPGGILGVFLGSNDPKGGDDK